MADKAIVEDILAKAILAPSADNTQPWRVIVSGDVIELFHVPERDISPYDTGQRGSLVAHGAFIENASLTATMHGKSLDVSIREPSAANNWSVATLTLRDTQAVDELAKVLQPHIADRATNRKPYLPTKLSDKERGMLVSAGSTGWGRVAILDAPQMDLCAAVSVTEQISFQNQAVHEQLFKNIRWQDDEVQRTRDGFSIRTFELPLPAYIMFSIAKSWEWLDFLNRSIGLAATIPPKTSAIYGHSAAYIGILGDAQTSADYIKVGRIMQRVWLAATADGIYVQPIGALLFFKKGIDSGTTTAFSEADISLINAAVDKISNAFQAKTPDKVIVVMRAGSGGPPSARTIRRKFEDVVTFT